MIIAEPLVPDNGPTVGRIDAGGEPDARDQQPQADRHIGDAARDPAERLSLQLAADPFGTAGDRVDLGRPVAQLTDGLPQCRRPIDLMVDLGESGVEKSSDVLTRRFASIANVQDLANLREGETRGLPAVDEIDPTGRLDRVIAVTGQSSRPNRAGCPVESARGGADGRIDVHVRARALRCGYRSDEVQQ